VGSNIIYLELYYIEKKYLYACDLRIIVVLKQGMTTVGDCRYRQAIPVGAGGRLDIDANYGIRKAFLPQVCKIEIVLI